MRVKAEKTRMAHRVFRTALALAAACVFGVPTQGLACTGMRITATSSELSAALDVRPDGSFEALASYGKREKPASGRYLATRVSGGAIKNLGEGRVGQKLTYVYEGCSSHEDLLFVDCNALEGLMLSGQSADSLIEGYSASTIAMIQYPKGPIRFGKGITVDHVAAVAAKHKISATRELYNHYATMKKKMRYNPYQGCKIFYPDSPGAQR